MLDGRASHIVEKALRGIALAAPEIEFLLGFDADSPEAAYVTSMARELGMRACKGHGFVFAQIGADCTPCAKNCRFCSFASTNAARRGGAEQSRAWEMSLDDIAHYAQLFSDAGVQLVSLMATAQLDFNRYLEMVRAVSANVRDGVVVMANAGDLTLQQARDLKDAGAMAAYHALRLGEGELTNIDPAERRQTIENLHVAGVPLMTGVEPVWAEADRAELAARICDIPRFHPFCIGACGLAPVEGADLDGRMPPAPEFLRYVAALTRLACGSATPIGGIGGVRWVDVGCDPRERGYGSSDSHLRQQVARATSELEAAGFAVKETLTVPLSGLVGGA